jgi:hypothetical protein
VLAWVLVVAVASGVTWAVIDGAGQSLLAGEGPVTETVPAPAAAPSQGAPSRRPSDRPTKDTATPAPSAAPGGATSSPSAAPSRPVSTAAPSGSSDDSGVERAWAGPSGLVVVRCDGSRPMLRSATPNNGYRVEVDRGAERIEVQFKSASAEVKVAAGCSGGVPRFTVEGDGGDGHEE